MNAKKSWEAPDATKVGQVSAASLPGSDLSG